MHPKNRKREEGIRGSNAQGALFFIFSLTFACVFRIFVLHFPSEVCYNIFGAIVFVENDAITSERGSRGSDILMLLYIVYQF